MNNDVVIVTPTSLDRPEVDVHSLPYPRQGQRHEGRRCPTAPRLVFTQCITNNGKSTERMLITWRAHGRWGRFSLRSQGHDGYRYLKHSPSSPRACSLPPPRAGRLHPNRALGATTARQGAVVTGLSPEERRELIRTQREVIWNLQRDGVVTVVRPGDDPVPYKRQGNPSVNTPQSVRLRYSLRKAPLIQVCFDGGPTSACRPIDSHSFSLRNPARTYRLAFSIVALVTEGAG